jgi:uncharacterized protein YndB with AHSA1/START domain
MSKTDVSPFVATRKLKAPIDLVFKVLVDDSNCKAWVLFF